MIAEGDRIWSEVLDVCINVWKSDEGANTLNTICCEPANVYTGYLSSCSREHNHYNTLLLALVDWLLDLRCTVIGSNPGPVGLKRLVVLSAFPNECICRVLQPSYSKCVSVNTHYPLSVTLNIIHSRYSTVICTALLSKN